MADRPEVRDLVATYGATTKAKFSNVAVTGAPEDQIRARLEELVKSLAAVSLEVLENLDSAQPARVLENHHDAELRTRQGRSDTGPLEPSCRL